MRIEGQIKLQRLNKVNTAVLNAFLSITRRKYDIDLLRKNGMPLTHEQNTLFGDFGTDGEYLIPNLDPYRKIVRKIPGAGRRIQNQASQMFELDVLNILREQGIQNFDTLPGECPQQKFGLIFQSPDDDDEHSYLCWDGSQDIDITLHGLTYLSNILRHFGSRFAGGVMNIYDGDPNGWVRAIIIDKNGTAMSRIAVTYDDINMGRLIGKEKLDPRATVYREDLNPDKRQYAACLKPQMSRNTEVFDFDHIPDEADAYDGSKWHLEENAVVFIGIVDAYDEQHAREIAAKKYDTIPELINVYPVLNP